MIELLVKYIQDRGFRVDVQPGYLLIRKKAYEQICCVCWAISKHELRPEWEEYLYWVATGYMEQIDKAIAEREVPEDAGMGQDGRMG